MKNVQHRNFVDLYGYMLGKSRYEGGDNGRGDAIARTVLAAIIYRLTKFIDVIEVSFSGFIFSGAWKPERHKDEPRTEDFSRDHTIWFVVWIRYFYPGAIRSALRIPYRISKKFKQTIDMWLWIRAVARDTWWDRFAYWTIASLMLRFNNRWNRWLRNRAGITSVPCKEFKVTPEDELTKKELFARKNCIPSYTIDTQAMMVHCLSDGWFKNRLKKRVIPLVERNNYFVLKLMDDPFYIALDPDLSFYTGMDAWRWGRRMDKTTDIEINALYGPQPEYNMDVDILNADLNWK